MTDYFSGDRRFIHPGTSINSNKLKDEELIIQLREKNEAAFKWLVESYNTKVFNTVLNIVQDTTEAEDIAQEVFIKVFESIGSFRGDASLSTWIYRISVHKSLDRLRAKKTRDAFSRMLPWIKSDQAEGFYHPGIALDQKEKAAVLFKVIKKLPEKQQVAFTLVKVQGMKYEEVSAIMQQSIKAIESLVSRAKINLQKYLEHYE